MPCTIFQNVITLTVITLNADIPNVIMASAFVPNAE
jgi:hypothetical protein